MGVPDPVLKEKLLSFLEEDMGFEDITTNALIPSGLNVKAQIIFKEPATVAGLMEVSLLFSVLGVNFRSMVKDGDEVEANVVVAELEGDGRVILTAERTALNILMRMSGIATFTRKLTRMLRDAKLEVRLAATRKTAPGLRYFDKRAVQIGGGDTHRFRLDDAVLIKDNHLAIVGSPREAVEAARKAVSFIKKIEVEAKSAMEALEAAETGADIVMLDNMTPEQLRETLKLLKEKGLRDRVLIEVSGGIDETNIIEYARTGPDIISIGALTHSVKAVDLSLEITDYNPPA